MAQQVQTATAAGASSSGEHGGRKLGAFLCWAVVFADIGTSVYYTPGILFHQFGALAGFFVILTLVAFVLLTLKYAEVSVRFPEGGGVVTVSARALNPWAGAVGGMFILVDYFLTSAISSLSGLQYFQDIFPGIGPFVLILTLIVLALLGVLNWWGIKESAIFSAVIAVAALISDVIILVLIFIHVPLTEIGAIFTEMFGQARGLAPITLVTGFAGAFLAFSGLESISQLAPVMRTPRRRTVGIALGLVAITVGVTSPLLTVFSTILLDSQHRSLVVHPVHHPDPNQFISLLGGAYGGPALEIATAITASALLIFASNTAIIGAYHVFLALSRMNFFPAFIERLDNQRPQGRGTPYISIILATIIPMLVLVAASGQIDVLGQLYAFGLLGAFSLTCISLDVIRYRERHGAAHVGAIEAKDGYRDPHALPARPAVQRVQEWLAPITQPLRAMWPNTRYWLGFLTTALVVVAWTTNLVSKPLATFFGGGLTILGLAIAVGHYRYKTRSTGVAPVYPMGILSRIANSMLVVLPSLEDHSADVIRAAVESAGTRRLVFLYLAEKHPVAQRAFEITDPYGNDRQAQEVFTQAARLAAHEGVTVSFVYRIGGFEQIAAVWRAIRPDEIVALASISKPITRQVAPEYVRYQFINGVKVAHYVRHPQPPQSPQNLQAAGATGGTGRLTPPPATTGAPAGKKDVAPTQRPEAPATQPEQPTGSPASLPAPDQTQTYRSFDPQRDGANGANGDSGANGSNGRHSNDAGNYAKNNGQNGKAAGSLKNMLNGKSSGASESGESSGASESAGLTQRPAPSSAPPSAAGSAPSAAPPVAPPPNPVNPVNPTNTQPQAGATSQAPGASSGAAARADESGEASDEADQWIWTGSDLVLRKDYHPEADQEQHGNQGK